MCRVHVKERIKKKRSGGQLPARSSYYIIYCETRQQARSAAASSTHTHIILLYIQATCIGRYLSLLLLLNSYYFFLLIHSYPSPPQTSDTHTPRSRAGSFPGFFFCTAVVSPREDALLLRRNSRRRHTSTLLSSSHKVQLIILPPWHCSPATCRSRVRTYTHVRA